MQTISRQEMNNPDFMIFIIQAAQLFKRFYNKKKKKMNVAEDAENQASTHGDFNQGKQDGKTGNAF